MYFITDEFGIAPSTLRKFLRALIGGYHDNPYHNFRHAFCVFHVCYNVVRMTAIREILGSTDVLSLLVAALVHDVDHPGVNNDFLIRTRDELALLYNDHSVLEHHHASTTFHMLQDDAINIFAALDEDAYVDVRRNVIDAILSTGEMRAAMRMKLEAFARFAAQEG